MALNTAHLNAESLWWWQCRVRHGLPLPPPLRFSGLHQYFFRNNLASLHCIPLVLLKLFNAKLSPKMCWQGLRSPWFCSNCLTPGCLQTRADGVSDPRMWTLRRPYLVLHCYHQNESALRWGRDEIHFNVSLTVTGAKSQDSAYWTTFEERGETQQNRTEVLLLTSLMPYR